MFSDDDKKYNFTQFDGGKDKTSASRMAQRVNDHYGFRTAKRVTPEETITYQTKGGMPQYRTEKNPEPDDDARGLPRGFVAKVAWIVGSTMTTLQARLLRYVGKWSTRVSDFTYGVPTGYSVVPNVLIPLPAEADKTYFDVVYFAGGDFMRYTSTNVGGVRTKLMESVSGSVYGVPLVINPLGSKSFPPEATIDADDYHVFLANETTVNHIAGRIKAIDTTVSKDTYIPDRLPVISDMGGYTFGYDPVTKRVTLYGDSMTYYGSMISNIYHWYLVLQISSAAPYITVHDVIANPCPTRSYRYFIDLGAVSASNSTSRNNPGFDPGGAPDSWPCISVYPYAMTPLYPEDLEHDPIVYKWDGVEGYAGKVSGARDFFGNGQVVTSSANAKVYDESFQVGTQIGVKEIKHEATVAVNYRYEYGVCTYQYRLIMPSYPGASWSIGGASVDPGQPVYGNAGGVTSKKTTNTSTTSVLYQLMLDTPIPLYSLEGTYDYDWLWYDQAIGVSLDSSDEDQNIGVTQHGFRGPLNNPPTLTRIRGVGIMTTSNQYADIQNGKSTVHVKCRDYIFHDIREDVSVYLEGEIFGERYGAKTQTSGVGSLTLKLVVNFRGAVREIEIMSSPTSGHNAGVLEHDLLYNGFLQPTCVYPHENPAFYHPVSEQGHFPHIAYTTKAEELQGVAPRFLLSIPLAINRHDMTVLGDANNPPPNSYIFTAYNLSWAQSQTQTGFFWFLYGKAFMIHVSHDGVRDWIADMKITDDKDKDHHFAEVYRV